MSGKNLKSVLPETAVAVIRSARKKIKKARQASRPFLTEQDFTSILINDLGLRESEVVFVHSSMDKLNLKFPFGRILQLLQQVIGEQGTMLFPTYPGLPSYEFLSRAEVFDVRKSPSFMGILTEYARRQPGAVRSLHPTKSVCAIGKLARELTATHQESRYPYDRCSPYYKLIEHSARIIGLGVSTERLAFVHCAEDALKDEFPVRTYHQEIFAARCIDRDGEPVIVGTLAHDLSKMNHRIPAFMKRHLPRAVCVDLKIKGVPFFRADAAKLFPEMVKLAQRGITIYPRSAY